MIVVAGDVCSYLVTVAWTDSVSGVWRVRFSVVCAGVVGSGLARRCVVTGAFVAACQRCRSRNWSGKRDQFAEQLAVVFGRAAMTFSFVHWWFCNPRDE